MYEKIEVSVKNTIISKKNYVKKMIYLTQLIYIKEGKEAVFHEFEEKAIPIIAKYNGQLILRIRPDDVSVIEKNIEKPYEIHLVAFPLQNDFDNFKKDEERKTFLHLKEDSIQTTFLIQGEKI